MRLRYSKRSVGISISRISPVSEACRDRDMIGTQILQTQCSNINPVSEVYQDIENNPYCWK